MVIQPGLVVIRSHTTESRSSVRCTGEVRKLGPTNSAGKRAESKMEEKVFESTCDLNEFSSRFSCIPPPSSILFPHQFYQHSIPNHLCIYLSISRAIVSIDLPAFRAIESLKLDEVTSANKLSNFPASPWNHYYVGP